MGKDQLVIKASRKKMHSSEITQSEVLGLCLILCSPDIPTDFRGDSLLPSCCEITLFKTRHGNGSSLT